jgi:hypothetical protein
MHPDQFSDVPEQSAIQLLLRFAAVDIDNHNQ